MMNLTDDYTITLKLTDLNQDNYKHFLEYLEINGITHPTQTSVLEQAFDTDARENQENHANTQTSNSKI